MSTYHLYIYIFEKKRKTIRLYRTWNDAHEIWKSTQKRKKLSSFFSFHFYSQNFLCTAVPLLYIHIFINELNAIPLAANTPIPKYRVPRTRYRQLVWSRYANLLWPNIVVSKRNKTDRDRNSRHRRRRGHRSESRKKNCNNKNKTNPNTIRRRKRKTLKMRKLMKKLPSFGKRCGFFCLARAEKKRKNQDRSYWFRSILLSSKKKRFSKLLPFSGGTFYFIFGAKKFIFIFTWVFVSKKKVKIKENWKAICTTKSQIHTFHTTYGKSWKKSNMKGNMSEWNREKS